MHRALNAALAVCDPEVARFAPAVVPAVLANPTALRVVIPDEAHAVASRDVARYVVIDTACVAEEVVIYRQAGRHRSPARQPSLHLASSRNGVESGDFGCAV